MGHKNFGHGFLGEGKQHELMLLQCYKASSVLCESGGKGVQKRFKRVVTVDELHFLLEPGKGIINVVFIFISRLCCSLPLASDSCRQIHLLLVQCSPLGSSPEKR